MNPFLAVLVGGWLPNTDSGYLVSIIVGVALLVGGIILLRLQKYM
jgi:LPXTG-motif cell wall-anchored protein